MPCQSVLSSSLLLSSLELSDTKVYEPQIRALLPGVRRDREAVPGQGVAVRLDPKPGTRKQVCDGIEKQCPVKVWPFASYRELLFLDCNQVFLENLVP